MIARKDSFRQEGMNGNSNSRSPPVNGLVEKAEKLQVSFTLGEGGGKKAKRKSFQRNNSIRKALVTSIHLSQRGPGWRIVH
jgi:hypothetical protein